MCNVKLHTIILACLIYTAAIPAQQVPATHGNIAGRITGTSNHPLESATLLLLNGADSSYVTGTASNQQGEFEIKAVKRGSYLLEASLLGYKNQSVPVVVQNGKITELPVLVLKEDVHMLGTVTVVGKQKAVELEAGRTVINLSSSVMGSQGNTLDALKNLPGVFVKEDGTVMLNGQVGATILINGKQAFLSGENLVSLLRSMPAASVDKIELITNPSSQFDAAGKSGLINIQTRAIKMQGITLNLNAGYEQGKYGRGYTGGRFTFQNRKLTLFADYNHYQGDKNIELDILRERAGDRGNVMQYTLRKYEDKADYFRVGFAYDITDKISAGAYTSGNLYRQTLPGSTQSQFSMTGQPVDSSLYTTNTNVTRQNSFTGGVNLGYKDNAKREADLSFDYLLFDHGEDLIMYNKMLGSSLQPIGQDTLKGDLNGDITMFSLQTNFVFPFSEKSSLRTGGKLTKVTLDNEALYTNPLNSGWEIDNGLSNQYTYDEDISAAYVQLNTSMGAIGIQAGLRMENTEVSGTHSSFDPWGQDSSYQNSYTNLFPNAVLQYSFRGSGNNLSLLYSRRIIRPSYRDLSPFNYIWDEYTVSQGNPNLKAEFTDNMELVFGYKKVYRASLFFSHTSDAIATSIHALENSKILIYPENLASNTRLGVRLDGGDLMKLPWWKLHANGSFYYSWYSWDEYGMKKESRRFTPSVSLNSQFILPKGWSAELTGFYNGWMVAGQALIHPIWSVNAGIQKKVWNDKATVRLFANDIFFTNRDKMNIAVTGLKGWSNQRHDMTTIGLSVSFNFKQGEQAKKTLRDTTIDESKRINL